MASTPLPYRRETHVPAILIGGLLLLGLCLARLASHLFFHSLVELFTIAVAWGVFFLAWNARRFLDNHYLLFIGIASLFVGTIDAAHTLSYKGMNVVPGAGADLPTQLWIAGRYVHSLSFLAAPLFLRRRLNAGIAFGVYGAAMAVLLGSIFAGFFPACYVEGAGLTRFKILSEYAAILVLLGSGALLFRRRADFERSVLLQLLAAIGLAAAAELEFTFYEDVYGTANVVGHLLRFLAFCFIYRAIIVTGIVRPYDLLFRNLARSEEALRCSDERYRAFVANGSEAICRMEIARPVSVSLPPEEQARLFLEHSLIAECNDAYARMHGLAKAADAMGARLADVLLRSTPPAAELARQFVLSLEEPGGESRCVAGSFTGVVENGLLVRAWGVQRDITERKRAAMERERLITELRHALAEVKTLSGLLPICANCKKIRDDKGYWTQVDAYFKRRADISFSHGICPECLRTLYPEYYAGAR
jgi:PAS domain-containing protein